MIKRERDGSNIEESAGNENYWRRREKDEEREGQRDRRTKI